MLAMNYMYEGQREFGLELARKVWNNIICTQGYTWDMPNLVDGAKNGQRSFGNDYYQNMMLWSLPAAVEGTQTAPPQGFDLWADEEAQKQFDFQWSNFARRYRGVPSLQLSFNLVNEPPNLASEVYCKVVQRAVAAIRHEDLERLVIADGLWWAFTPAWNLAELGIAQSMHAYQPRRLTCYRASWIEGSDRWPTPTWPLVEDGQVFDRRWLRQDRIEPWQKLSAMGVGVHVGEWGALNWTPHEVVLAWGRDLLSLFKESGWGWALWNFRGVFGILDSGRTDVAYEDFHGHKLDRKFLELLQREG